MQPRPISVPTLEIEKSFRETERNGEIVVAVFRILIAATMLMSAWTVTSAGHAAHPLLLVALVYALISLVGLGLTLGKVFHPLAPYIFVLLDTLMIALALAMLGQMHGLDSVHEFSLPIFSLAFIVLIHTALRYRPWLVIFGALAFIVLVFALPSLLAQLPSLFGMTHEVMWTVSSPAHPPVALGPHDIGLMPLVFLLLAAAILFYIVERTRGLALLAQRDGKRAAQLTRFFSPEVANRIVADGFENRSHGQSQMVAILFIDIRGFTSLSENMSSDALTEMLASFRTCVCQIVFDHGGTIDKFIGDAILVVFGTPIASSDDPEKAIRAAFAISDGVRRWYCERIKINRPAALVGIGVHFGEAYAGVIESGPILEHTVIGDAVNVAQRLERLTRSIAADIIVSSEIVKAAGIKAGDLGLSRKTKVKITGHKARATIYHAKLNGPEESRKIESIDVHA